jgi:parallel beta-helix repeat protein
VSIVLRGRVGARPCRPAASRLRVSWALGVLLFLAPATASAQIYYVDQASLSCSAAGPGTEAQPYCTINSALLAHAGPGVTIRVKPGTYREQVTVNVSGTSGSPLVIEAVGPGVVIDAADSFSSPASWVLLSGDVHLAAGVTWAPFQVFKNGARLTPSTAAPASLPPNSFTWVSGEGLYVNAGGGNPGDQQLLVGNRAYGFSLNARSWVTIDGFDVRHAEDRGFNLGTGCANVVIRDNQVSWSNGYGMRINGSTGITIENNTVSNGNFHGIGLLANSTGCILRGNESFANADPAVSRANGIYLLTSPNNTLSGNRVHDNQDTGIMFTTGANNCTSFNNRSWRNGDHGVDHLQSTGTIHSNDVVFGNHRDGFSIEGSATGTRLHNCIAVDNGLTTNRYDLWVDPTSVTGFVSDYNIFWNSTSQDPIKYVSTWHATLATYQAASGQDAHSLQDDPKFVNAGSGDFHLQPGSPAIDAAASDAPAWPATDAEGNGRVDVAAVPNSGAGPIPWADLGALEYVGGQPPFVTAPATATVAENAQLTVNVTAADPDLEPITSLTASGLPAGATFTPGVGNFTGTLSWKPGYTQSGSYTVTFTASNELASSATTQITVTNTDRAPVVTAPSSASVDEGVPLTVNVTAADPDGQAITSLTATNLPAGATFTPGPGDTTGTLTWTPDFTQSGSYNITFQASNTLTGTKTTQVSVSGVNRPPVVIAPETATVVENAPLTINVTANDPDGQNIQSLTASGLPSGATFNASSGNTAGTMTWTPTLSQAGTYTVIFTASNSRTGRDTTVITVTDFDRVPVVTAPATASVAENAQLTFNVSVSDPDGQAISSLVATDLPAGATFTPGAGNTTGVLSWKPDFTQSGSHAITFTATNTSSGSATTQVTVHGTDRAPAVTAPATAAAAENALLTVQVTAADPDADAILSLTAANLPPGATFTPGTGNTTGTLSWTPNFSQSGSYTVSFTASNALSGSATTEITVSGTDQPPVVSAPDTTSGFEGELLTVNISVVDPDGEAIDSVTVTGLPAGASFTPGSDNKSGSLAWVPDDGQAGSLAVTFVAHNAITGSKMTVVKVSPLRLAVPGETAVRLAPLVVPNPIRGSGSLRFGTSKDGAVRVDIFDLSGRLIGTPLDEAQARAGEFAIPLGSASRGAPLTPGLYFYRVRTPEGTTRGRFLVRR